jgi:hypothetical protein
MGAEPHRVATTERCEHTGTLHSEVELGEEYVPIAFNHGPHRRHVWIVDKSTHHHPFRRLSAERDRQRHVERRLDRFVPARLGKALGPHVGEVHPRPQVRRRLITETGEHHRSGTQPGLGRTDECRRQSLALHLGINRHEANPAHDGAVRLGAGAGGDDTTVIEGAKDLGVGAPQRRDELVFADGLTGSAPAPQSGETGNPFRPPRDDGGLGGHGRRPAKRSCSGRWVGTREAPRM